MAGTECRSSMSLFVIKQADGRRNHCLNSAYRRADAATHLQTLMYSSWPQGQRVGRNGYMYVCKIACNQQGYCWGTIKQGCRGGGGLTGAAKRARPDESIRMKIPR